MQFSPLVWNIYGHDFLYTHNGNKGYSTHGKETSNIIWKTDGSGNADVYLETAFGLARENTAGTYPKPQYLWLLESRAVQAHVHDYVRNNMAWCKNRFQKIFTYNTQLVKEHPDLCYWVPASGYWVKTPGICDKSKVLSIIASNKTFAEGHRYRHEIIARFPGNMDVFGSGYRYIHQKEEGLNDYMFQIVIENTRQPGYFTEKILDCFVTGTVPIYWGCPDIGDFFNMDGVILLDDTFDPNMLTAELYTTMKTAIHDNFHRALQYDLAENFMCRIHEDRT